MQLAIILRYGYNSWHYYSGWEHLNVGSPKSLIEQQLFKRLKIMSISAISKMGGVKIK